jgi:tetratricopeptide (TPR) repeat protein
MNDNEKAIELNKEAADIFKNTVGEKHFHFANSLNSIGECYLAIGTLDKALEYFKQAEALYILIYGNENDVTINTQKQIKALYKQKNSSLF